MKCGIIFYSDLGVYSKTFFEILRVDIWKFLKLFSILLIAFTGTIYLAMKAETGQNTKM